jgi:hypothetical protein
MEKMSSTQDLVNRTVELGQAGEHENAFLLLDAAASRTDPKTQYFCCMDVGGAVPVELFRG